MAIRPPVRDLARLLSDLASPDAPRRESAAARLTLIGVPAAARLAALAADPAAAADTRQAALHALAGIDASRATAIAATALSDASDVVSLEAIDVLATAAHGDTAASTSAFEQLTELAFDRRQPVGRRLAVLTALRGFPAHLLAPIDEALAVTDGQTAFGDVTALAPLAAAWVAAAGGDKAWRDRLAALFAAIVARADLTRDHPLLVQVLTTHPAAGVLVASAPRRKTK